MSEMPVLTALEVDGVISETARPFTMPSSRRDLINPSGMLIGVVLSLMLTSGGLLAWFALMPQDENDSIVQAQVQEESESLQFASGAQGLN